MHPAFAEAATLSVMGISGVAAGLLFGIRQWVPLGILALAFSVVTRVWSAFTVWSLGWFPWLSEAWWVVSGVLIASATGLFIRQWRVAFKATTLVAAASLVALASKYIFDAGEKHHTDSAKQIALAVIAIGGEVDDLQHVANSPKRGIAYSLMLGLGPDGRVFSAFTPLVFIATMLLVVWLAWKMVDSRASLTAFVIASAAVGLFSVSVPMFRVAMFYMNAHTLMGFGLLLTVAGLILAIKEREFSRLAVAFVTLGGVIGATARIEGIVAIAAVLAALVGSRRHWTTSERVNLFASVSLIGASFTWWLDAVDSPVLDDFGLNPPLLTAASLLAGLIASQRAIDGIRRYIWPTFAVGTIGVLALGMARWSDVLPNLDGLWLNLGLGRGGWGTAAYMFFATVVLLGYRRHSFLYRYLLRLVGLLLVVLVITKGFDGTGFGISFGRESFFDSLNRMWLHVMPVVMAMTILGYSELLERVQPKNRSSSTDETSARPTVINR